MLVTISALIRPSACLFFSLPSPSCLSNDNMSMNIVPADVLLEVADYLSCPSEILHLYLTVRANNKLVHDQRGTPTN